MARQPHSSQKTSGGVVVPSYHRPPPLTRQAALAVAKCLTYEDYEECYHYRWDPVNIWQFEIPQKKKKGKKSAERSQIYSLSDGSTSPPQPQWRELRKFRDWWWEADWLGTLDSVLRTRIVDAFEHLSWTSKTEEEYVLFLLIRLCIDTKIEIGGESLEIISEWSTDLAQIVTQLGPFPLQKLFVTHDSLGIKPILTALVQQSPHLQVVHMNQWALSNDFMMSLGAHCSQLTEFAIPSMQPQVFMSDEALFSCFFDGMSSEEVLLCWHTWVQRGSGVRRTSPRLSFPRLRYVDILYWKQTERFIQMLSLFYPKVRLRGVDAYEEEGKEDHLLQPFVAVGAQITARTISCRTRAILDERLQCVIPQSPYLRELRIHVDDAFPGADCDSIFERRLEEAGTKLKTLVGQISAFDSLSLRPHEGVDVTKVALPLLHTHGSCITSLHLCYEFCPLNSNNLFMIVNLCPRLHYLALSLMMGESDVASLSYRTSLQPHPNLHTLVVQDIPSEGPQDNSRDHSCITLIMDILRAATNLEMLGLSCLIEMDDQFTLLASECVQLLHLQFVGEMISNLSAIDFFLRRLLPNFPSLHTLSFEEHGRSGIFDHEAVAHICQTGIHVTRWKPEFFQLPKWDSSNGAQNTFNLYVM